VGARAAGVHLQRDGRATGPTSCRRRPRGRTRQRARLFERFGGREDDAEAAYVHEVASSSIYIGILGRRYGRQLVTRFSATHTEYLAAEENGLRVAVWAKNLSDREGHAQSFLDDVQTFHTTGVFGTPEELADDVERRIRRIGSEDLAPWVKLGSVVFRARTITEKAGRVDVVAQIRDRGVLAQIEGMRSDRWGSTQERVFTYIRTPPPEPCCRGRVDHERWRRRRTPTLAHDKRRHSGRAL
jgi:hypothetical protein